MALKIDYSLYLVTDRTLSRKRSLSAIVSVAVLGGVSCVQLREKNCSTREFVSEARQLLQVLQPKKIPLIINDRVDVALAVGADGIHLGQSDMGLQDARRLVGKTMIVGISAESTKDALEAEKYGADYIGVSPVFSTETKADIAPPLGLLGVAEIRRRVSIPVVGIGGINLSNCADVIRAGADGVAVVSAIVASACPETASRDLHQAVRQALS
ncbi:MAG: thiamine phosphate synthase [Desulfobulbaceae bacterium]|nr:thiamine phosphate synthase [Desulfobulbaceae bacterium]